MNYKNEKLNIEIENSEHFEIVEGVKEVSLKVNGVVQFTIFENSTVHACNSSAVYAYNNSTIRAYNSSTVCAYNNSTIHAYDSSTVCAYDNSTIHAYNSSTVRAYDSSTIRVYHSSTVYAYYSSTVRAYNSSTVHAYDSSTIHAYNSSTIHAYDSSTVRAYYNSTIYTYGNSTVRAYGNSTISAYEFSTLYIYNSKVIINANNHFGAIIKQVFKIKKDIIVYKKLKDNKIATLKLVKGQTFQSEHFNKCRIDRAVVVEITNIENTEKYQNGVSIRNDNFIYEVGKEVIADKYDKNIEECSNGIHFFLTRENAEKYVL